jgi:3-hydroxy-9,10-secoandrosta-1,3,5(10)-triene-9,17-dione monooxygenase reductase component
MSPAAESPDLQLLRAARRRWASGVAVVTTRLGDGFRGATVTAFAVASLDPPLVLVCLDRDGRMATAVPDSGSFAVSILERSHEFPAERFAGRAPLADPRFTGVAHDLTGGGNPILRACLAWFDCALEATHDGGDHVVVVGRVVELGLGPDTEDPLVYYDGRYRRLG